MDLEQTLGAVPEQQRQAFQAVCEVYGSTRTMLACLDRPLLNEVRPTRTAVLQQPPQVLGAHSLEGYVRVAVQVCQGLRDPATGQQQDLWALLAPVRAIRPSQGGPAFSEEMVTFIRSLNFDLD